MIAVKHNNSIGIIQNLKGFLDENGESLIELMSEIGIETLQVLVNESSCHLLSKENAEKLLKMVEGKLRITSLWAGWHSGNSVWNFVEGPSTLGIVPEHTRAARMKELKADIDFANLLGVKNVATHVGFIPEQPCYAEYQGVVDAVAELADYCGKYGMHFNFETGQETPVTLMRTIADIGRENLGVNLDPANLIVYGRANPIDAIDIYGNRIRSVHVKDGNYPKDDYHKLGKQVVVGEGTVNFPVFLPKLLDSGYKGDLYIEHEISGRDEERINDIKNTVKFIKSLM